MNKKGFTLIELLAVIIVLAIISLISVPIILNSIKNKEEDSYKISVLSIAKSAEEYYAKKELNNEAVDISQNVYPLIEFKGTKPTSGEVKINDKAQIEVAVVYNNICYYKKYGEEKVNVLKYVDTCSVGLEVSNIETDQYVQDGLILHLDSINNVTDGHNLESTIWRDLSSQKNDVLNIQPSKWTNNSLKFDSTTAWLKTKNPISSTLLSKNMTMEIFLSSTTYKYVQIGLGNNVHLKLRVETQKPYWNTYPITGQNYLEQYNLNEAIRLVYRNDYDNASANKWFNNQKSAAQVSNLNEVNTPFDLGSGEYLIGEIYAIRLYNRSLTDQEIEHNYQLDLERY